MENKKHSISIGESLYKDLKEYCELNSLKLNEFAESLLKNALMIEKYGDAPFFTQPKVVEPEPIRVEKINTVLMPFATDTPDADGRIYPKEVVTDAIEKFNEQNQQPTPEKIENITKEIVETKEKPKRKITKLK